MDMLLSPPVIAEVSLLGMGLDVMGGCYLAYDLLGGKRGPLRTVARATGYLSLFFLGSVLLLGVRFALVASVGMGALLAVEYSLADNGGGACCRYRLGSLGLLRGLALGVAGMTVAGIRFGAYFGLLTGVGLAMLCNQGFSPADDFEVRAKPSATRHKILASALRAVLAGTSGSIAGFLVRHDLASVLLGVRFGVAAGIVSGLVCYFSPAIEWWIEDMPGRRLGMFGLAVIFLGVLLQSIQYWVVVFDLR